MSTDLMHSDKSTHFLESLFLDGRVKGLNVKGNLFRTRLSEPGFFSVVSLR